MQGFDISELFYRYKYPILVFMGGMVLFLAGIFVINNRDLWQKNTEVLGESINDNESDMLVVEISGEVLNPGVYKLPPDSRVEDLLSISGGFSPDYNPDWTQKYLNRASKLTDGQKIYIPSVTDQQTYTESANKKGVDQNISTKESSVLVKLVNINNASIEELDNLQGIGRVYGEKIIEHRPYSNVTELVSKGVLKQNVFLKIKDSITVY